MPPERLEERITDQAAALGERVTGGLRRLGAGEMDGSHLYGVALGAGQQFEVLLRGLLRWHLTGSAIDYDAVIRPTTGKPLHRLSLGQLIEVLADVRIGTGVREETLQQFRAVNRVRVALVHFPENLPTLRWQARALLAGIESIVSIGLPFPQAHGTSGRPC